MNLFAGARWLLTLGSRRANRRHGSDPADMGTAFGLDASFRDELDARLEPKPLTAAPWLSRHTGLPRRN